MRRALFLLTCQTPEGVNIWEELKTFIQKEIEGKQIPAIRTQDDSYRAAYQQGQKEALKILMAKIGNLAQDFPRLRVDPNS